MENFSRICGEDSEGMCAEEMVGSFAVKQSRNAEQSEDLSFAEESEGRRVKINYRRAM